MNKKRNLITKLVITGTLIMSVMLFIRNPLESYERLNQALWNMGHLFFFAFLCGLLLTQTPLMRHSWPVKLVFSLLLSVMLGGVIEVAQYTVGRYMEFHDLLLDVLGGLLGFLIVVFYLSKTAGSGEGTGNTPQRNILAATLIIVVLFAAFYPVLKIMLDNYRMQRDFPVLANFESVSELERWESDYVNRIELDQRTVKEGKASLLVQYGVGEYSAVTLQFFSADWRGYDQLNISIHNDQSENLSIELKIFDQQHTETGYKYADRFNRKLTLLPGWNEVGISLQDIQNAPDNRKIDLQNMTVISLFVYQQSKPQTIHLDDIHLSYYDK